MQILGLTWAGAEQEFVATAADELKRLQRTDGGWAQTPELESDAYATGQVLYTLHEAGVPSTKPLRAAQLLVRTQRDDGSWYVKSRAPKFQPYFQSNCRTTMTSGSRWRAPPGLPPGSPSRLQRRPSSKPLAEPRIKLICRRAPAYPGALFYELDWNRRCFCYSIGGDVRHLWRARSPCAAGCLLHGRL